MEQKEYINPFSKTSELYARKLDDASLSGNIVSLEQFWAEIEKILPDEDTASQARLARETGHLLKPQKRRRQAVLEAWGCQPLLRRNRGRARCDSECLFF